MIHRALFDGSLSIHVSRVTASKYSLSNFSSGFFSRNQPLNFSAESRSSKKSVSDRSLVSTANDPSFNLSTAKFQCCGSLTSGSKLVRAIPIAFWRKEGSSKSDEHLRRIVPALWYRQFAGKTCATRSF